MAAVTFIQDTLAADPRARVLLCATQDTAKSIRDQISGEYHDRLHRAHGDKSRGKMFTHIVAVDMDPNTEFAAMALIAGFRVPVTDFRHQ